MRANQATGANTSVSVYVDGAKQKAISQTVIDWTDKQVMRTGADEYLGSRGPEQWQRYQHTEGSFTVGASSPVEIERVNAAIRKASLTKQSEIVIIIRQIDNAGVTCVRTLRKCVLEFAFNAKGKGAPNVYSYTFKGTEEFEDDIDTEPAAADWGGAPAPTTSDAQKQQWGSEVRAAAGK